MATKGGKVKGQNASISAMAATGASSSTSVCVPAPTPSPSSQAMYLQKLQESSEAIKAGNFRRAIQLYTESIVLDPENHILYTNRAAAHLKNGQPDRALEDAVRARSISAKWGKAYLREGEALQELGRHGDALAALATGLGQDRTNSALFQGLVEAALRSPLKDKLEPTFHQLEKFGLKSSPFVIIAVIGQELVAAGHFSAAVSILEAALKVGTCSLKLRGSVFSALSSALWGLGRLDKAIYHMQQDLAVAKNMGDQEGECRAYGNLGSAYFTQGRYKESLANHRFQLVLAMKLKSRAVAASALSSLGHVYTAIGDYPNALAAHKQCVLLLKQSRETLAEAREIGNVGAVYLAMGNFEDAVECHQEHLKIAREEKSNVEEARAYSNLGSAYHYRRDYTKATLFHKEVLKIAEQNKDKTLEARAYAGLGHAARCSGDTMSAKAYHEKQLDNALQTKDKVAEGRACSNLGIIFHQLGEFEAALKLHKVHMKIAQTLQDRASQGRAHGNIGNAYSALGKHELAVKHHKQELAISSEVNDRHSEGSTHGNLAVAYQALGMTDNALHHYQSHLRISQELKDLPSEARALCNLGNFHCARGNHSSAVSFYEQFLALSKTLNDSEAESKACFNLGYVHFNLSNFTEAIKYYQQDLTFARDRKDRLALARAYCNLGLAQKALQRFEEALDCQKKCLKLMDALENTPGKLRALGNIGDLMLKVGDVTEAIKIYQQQLGLAKQCNSPDLLATAYGALGSAHRLLGQYDKSLAYHTQELNIRQEIEDVRGECRAHGNVGNVHMSLGNFLTAFKCYQEMLERSRELGDHRLEGQACGNLGITRMNMGQYEEAIGLLEEQLAMLEQHYGPTTLQDKGKAFGNLGDCYEALGDYEDAVKWHEQSLIIAQQTGSLPDQDRAYRGLGNAHKAIQNLQQALVCFEKRLYVAHQTDSAASQASAYGELGCLHSLLGNLEQAIACLEHQLSLAQEMGDATCQGDAACGLGGVYQQIGEYATALKYHQMDLSIAEETGNTACQCRAYGNIGLSHESLGNLEEAISHQEQHLSIAAQLNDGVAKTLAYSSLGRVHHALGHYTQAVQYLQQGLVIAEQLRRREDEAKIRHRLGLALWAAGDLEPCQQQLHRAADLFETIRRESQCSSEYRLSLFDLQSACYQTLQRVLVSLARHDEALVVAERACTRAFIDLLLERQAGSAGLFNGTSMDLTPASSEQITSAVASQASLVLCFSIAAGHLYSWLLTPSQGMVKFHSQRLSDLEADSEAVDTHSVISASGVSLLDQCVGQVRESMGIESHITTTSSGHRSSTLLSSGRGAHPYKRGYGSGEDTDSDGPEHDDDVFQLHLEEMDRLTAGSDRSGFLAMLNRSHQLNASSYSLGSLLSAGTGSLGSGLLDRLGGSMRSLGLAGGGSVRSLGLGSAGGSAGSVRSLVGRRLGSRSSRNGGIGAGGSATGAKSPLAILYHLLIEPMESAIQEARETEAGISGGSIGALAADEDSVDLVLVLQGDLYLIPFLMLRREQADKFLFEKYTTIIVPSISALNTSGTNSSSQQKGSQTSIASAGAASAAADSSSGARTLGVRKQRPTVQSSGALVVGNPRLTPLICQHWRLQEIPGAEFEARILGELLTCRALIGAEATKGAVLHQIEQVEVVHFATHISWKLSSIVLSPGEMFLSSPPASQHHHHHFSMLDSDGDSSSSDIAGPINGAGASGGPALSEYLLTAADILNLKLRAKLVVLNSGYTDDRAGRVNTDGVVGLTRALLSAGAQCVLFSLWPVPDPASKLLMKTLYTALLDGVKITRALSQAVRTVQTTAQFSHPSNWGGWVLVGADVALSSKSALMGHALGLILEAQATCRQTLKVLLHLVEKSLQRIHQGCKNSMFTTQASIENKVGQVAGWKELLHAVGFRFEPSTGGLPPAVFFPQADPSDRLTQASASLQAFLGLPTNSVSAMSKFVTNLDVGEALIQVLREILSKLSAKETGIDVMVDVRMWDVPGCHEFLASLGLDLVAVGSDNVTLRLSKQAMRRYLQFALQALVSVFDTQEAPRTLHLDTSSSMESLSSTQSGPSSSTFSKSSATPPTSPMARGVTGGGTIVAPPSQKRSLFNPAEMERVRSSQRSSLMVQGSLSARQVSVDPGSSSKSSRSRSSASEQSTPSASPRSPRSPVIPQSAAQSPPLDPALQLSHQARIRHMYGGQSAGSNSVASEVTSGGRTGVDAETNQGNEKNRLPHAEESNENVEEDDDVVHLAGNAVAFKKKSGQTFSEKGPSSVVVGDKDEHFDDNDDSVLTLTDEKEHTVHSDLSVDGLYIGGDVGSSSDPTSSSVKPERTGQIRRLQPLRSSRGSSSSSSKAVESEDQEEPVTPKSVTFADQLISEEISFDPSSPHLGVWSGVGDGGSRDVADSAAIAGTSSVGAGRTAVELPGSISVSVAKRSSGLGNLSGTSTASTHDDSDSDACSGRTASQLREHFEKMNASSNGFQQNKQTPLPASRNSLVGRKQQGVVNTSSSSQSFPSSSPFFSPGNKTSISDNVPSSITVSTSLASDTNVVREPRAVGNGPAIAGDEKSLHSPGDVSASQPAENLALRVLADVASQRAAVERMQMHSIIQSQDAGRKLRQEQKQQQQQQLHQQRPHPVPAQRPRRSSTSSQNSSLAPSRDSPSSLSLSSDINDSLVGPSSSAPHNVVMDDNGERVLPTSGYQSRYGHNSSEPGHVKVTTESQDSFSSQIAPASRNSAQTTRGLPSSISHSSFADNGGITSAVLSSPSYSASPANMLDSVVRTTSGTTGKPHPSFQQQPVKPVSRNGLGVTARPSPQSAHTMLFPQGGRPIPPGQRPVVSNGFSVGAARLGHTPVSAGEGGDAHHLGVGGSGENSISSDNSEGAESNLQSSASSGYHSEHSGLFRGVGVNGSSSSGSGVGSGRADGNAGLGTTALTRTQLPNEDRGLYTQEFVNRAPSFTFSSGSSSPFSRASNDEMASPVGPDVLSNNTRNSFSSGKTIHGQNITSGYQHRLVNNQNSVLGDVMFPSQTSGKHYPFNMNSNASTYHDSHAPQNTKTLHNRPANMDQCSGTLLPEKPTSFDLHTCNASFRSGLPGDKTSENKPSFPLGRSNADEGSNSSLSSTASLHHPSTSLSSLPAPATPLVRTNALGPSPHSRPESSNSLSSQYSTSSSTLSTIYRPLPPQQHQQQQPHRSGTGGEERVAESRLSNSASKDSPRFTGSQQNSQAKYPPLKPRTHAVNPSSLNSFPNSEREGSRVSYKNDNSNSNTARQQQQPIRPYRPISMSSNISSHSSSSSRKSGDQFTGPKQPHRVSGTFNSSSAVPTPYMAQGYNRAAPTSGSSNLAPSAVGGKGDNSSSRHPQHAANDLTNRGTDYHDEEHDYRAKLEDTQRNMFSKMQQPKLTNYNSNNNDCNLNSRTSNSYGYNNSTGSSIPRAGTASYHNPISGYEHKRGLAPPLTHPSTNQAPSVSTKQQTFHDPRSSVPHNLVLRSSKC